LRAFTRDQFDSLDADARRVSFTVARVATAESVERVRDLISDAQRYGRTYRQVRPALREAVDSAPLSAPQLEAIFRTYVGRAQAAGALDSLNNPMVRDEFPYRMWSATHDARTEQSHKDMEHSGLDGTAIYRADDPIWTWAMAPVRWNSVVPGTIIQGDVEYASKARYSGKVFKFSSKSGRSVTVTANHPVLTNRGFIPAKSITIGENLLCDNRPVNSPAMPSNNANNPPTRIENIFESFSRSSRPHSVKGSGLNFNSKVDGWYGNIEVVAANRILSDNFQPYSPKSQGSNFFITSYRDFAFPRLGFLGSPDKNFLVDFLSSVIRPHLLQVLRQAKPRNPRSSGFGLAADWDVSRYKTNANSATADSEIFRQLIFRNPGNVFSDKLVNIDVQHYDGLVYDVQTTTGHMVADGIVVSNCRCNSSIPISIEDAARYGVREAIKWMETGIPPVVPTFVKSIPLKPVKNWVPTGGRLLAV